MPISKGEKKKKKKKKPLTNAEILKLIKKLKPKNQQIVRVNVGDRTSKTAGGGSGAGSMKPYAQQDAVIFTSAYAPPTPAPPVPSAPLPPAPALKAPTFNAPKRIEPLPPQRLTMGDPFKPSKLSEKIAKQFGKYPSGSKLLEEEEYSYSKPATFKEPVYQKPSDLGARARFEVFTGLPRINDPYYDDGITITENVDQIGLTPAAVSSDAWTLTPEGVEEPLAAAVLAPPLPPEEEPTLQMIPEDLPPVPPPRPKPKASSPRSTTIEGAPIFKTSMITEINAAIAKGEFDLAPFEQSINLSKSNTYQTGKNKGQLRNNTTAEQLNTIYEALKQTY